MKERLIAFAFREHINFFLPAMAFPILFIIPLASIVTIRVSYGILSLMWAGLMSLAIGFHIEAFNLTINAIKMSGKGVEKNPVARLMFRKLGFSGAKWLTTVFIPMIGILPFIAVGISLFTVLAFGGTVVWINAMDWLNDEVAIRSRDYLLTNRVWGIPCRGFLPYPTKDTWSRQPEKFVQAIWGQTKI